jgi:tRNA pseudouridine13 synthase
LANLSKRLASLQKSGFANYFNDQRFGDAGSGDFLGEMLVKRRFDAAVKKIITTCHPEAPSSTRKRKSAIADIWGKWEKVAALCPEPALKPIVEALKAGEGAIGALRKVPREEMGQYLSSYQSFLWNMVLKGSLEQRTITLFEIPCITGTLLQYEDLSEDELAFLSLLQVPTVGADMLPLTEGIKRIMSRVLFERGVKLAKFRLPEIPQAYFASFLRPAIVIPGELKWEAAPDSLFPGRQMLRLEFFLPRGSFATMLIKSIGGETE